MKGNGKRVQGYSYQFWFQGFNSPVEELVPTWREGRGMLTFGLFEVQSSMSVHFFEVFGSGSQIE
jgi:hypothetical protein